MSLFSIIKKIGLNFENVENNLCLDNPYEPSTVAIEFHLNFKFIF